MEIREIVKIVEIVGIFEIDGIVNVNFRTRTIKGIFPSFYLLSICYFP